MNYGELGALERRCNNTENCHVAKLTRAMGKEVKYPTTQKKTTAFLKFKIRALRCFTAVQEKLHDQVITREIKRVCEFSEITQQ